MKNYVLFFVCLLALSSCKSIKILPKKTTTTTTVKDSIARKTILRDTLIQVPADSVRLTAKLSELTPTPLLKTSSTGRTSVSLSKTGELITADCHTEQLEKIIALQDQLIELYRTKETKTLDETTIVQKVWPSWLRTLLWFGLGIIAALVLPNILKTMLTRIP